MAVTGNDDFNSTTGTNGTGATTVNSSERPNLTTAAMLIVAVVVNNTTSENVFTGFSKLSGTATIGSFSSLVSRFNADLSLDVAWAPILTTGSLALRASLSASRKAAIGWNFFFDTDLTSPVSGSNSGEGESNAAASGSVVLPTDGMSVGIGGWENVTPGTPTSSPSTWFERIENSSSGGGGGATKVTIYFEQLGSGDGNSRESAPGLSGTVPWMQAVVALQPPVIARVPRSTPMPQLLAH